MKKEGGEVKPGAAVPTAAQLALKVYDPVEACLKELETRINATNYDVTTTAGMELARKDRRECVTIRTKTEAIRVERNAPRLEAARADKAVAEQIVARVKAVEDRVDKMIKEVEERKAAEKAERDRIEAARKSAIANRIDKIKDLPRVALDAADSIELEMFIAKVEAQQLGATFAEFQADAQAAKTEAVTKLNEMLVSLKAKEAEAARIKAEQEAEAARLEEIRIQQEKEKAEQDRLNAIEAEKLAAERAELERLRKEDAERRRLADEKAAAEKAETERLAAEKQAKIDAERAEVERQKREIDEAKRVKVEALAEKERKLAADNLAKQQKAEAEKRQKEYDDRMNALTATHLTTLRAILGMAQDDTISAPAAIQGIVHLAKLGIERGKA